MRTIKIFLASSNELKNDRDEFERLISRLNTHYDNRGYKFVLNIWEYIDPAYMDKRKQDEYNDYIRQCDVFVVLFYLKAGGFTLEEFNVAEQENKKRQLPLYIYFKEDQSVAEKESVELTKFKNHIELQLKHFWAQYKTTPELHFEFALWLDGILHNGYSAISCDDGTVYLDGVTIAEIGQQPFAKNNSDYQRMCDELQKYPRDIDKANKLCEKYPKDEDLQNNLKNLIENYEKLKEEFKIYVQSLLNTAKLISEKQNEYQIEKLKEARAEFIAGHHEAANTLLKQIMNEAEHFAEHFEQDRQKMHQYIEASRMRASTVMTELEYDIDNRIDQAIAIYEKADMWAKHSDYDDKNYVQLLSDYAAFLKTNSRFIEAEQVYLRLVEKLEKLSVPQPIEMATAYNGMGSVYLRLKDIDKAKGYFEDALSIREKYPSEEQPETTASSYHHLGSVYFKKKDYIKALDFFNKAKEIREEVLGKMHAETASSYQKIGEVYFRRRDFTKYLPYMKMALDIRIKLFGRDHPETAKSFDSLGQGYKFKKDYYWAFHYFMGALKIRKKTLGKFHSMTALSYENIGESHELQGHLDKALNYYKSALSIREATLSPADIKLAETFESVGRIYERKRKIDQAIKSYEKAVGIYEKSSEANPKMCGQLLRDISNLYKKQKNIQVAIDCNLKALDIYKQHFGNDHEETIKLIYNIGTLYEGMGIYDQALKFYKETLEILEKKPNSSKNKIADLCFDIGMVHEKQGDEDQSNIFFDKSRSIYSDIATVSQDLSHSECKKKNSKKHIENQYTLEDYEKKKENIKNKTRGLKPPFKIGQLDYKIAMLYFEMCDYDKVIEHCLEFLSLYEKHYHFEYNEISNAYDAIGAAFKALKDYDQALIYRIKSLNNYQNVMDIEDPLSSSDARTIMDSRNKIAELYFLKGEYKNALECHQKALMVSENVFGERHTMTCLTIRRVAEDYEALGDLIHAKICFTKIYKLYTKKYGSDNPFTVDIKECLDRLEPKLKSLGTPAE